MKNKVLIICASFILLIFLTYGTYAWYTYFLAINATGTQTSFNKDNLSNYKVGNLEFKEDGAPIYDANAKSIEDVDISLVPAYKFSVINNDTSTKKYTLYIEDVPVNLVDDGCTEDNLLSRNDLKYQLILNNEVIKEDYLSSIKDNILDSREIEVKKTNSYSLKIYIHDAAVDWFSKHYHYKVVLKK